MFHLISRPAGFTSEDTSKQTRTIFIAPHERLSEICLNFAMVPSDYSKNEAKNWLKTTVTSWRAGTAYHFAIFDKDRETFHGGCSLECNNDHPTANLGYWVQSASTGQGICTEAAIGLADFGHRELGLQRVEIIMSTKNTKSQARCRRKPAPCSRVNLETDFGYTTNVMTPSFFPLSQATSHE